MGALLSQTPLFGDKDCQGKVNRREGDCPEYRGNHGAGCQLSQRWLVVKDGMRQNIASEPPYSSPKRSGESHPEGVTNDGLHVESAACGLPRRLVRVRLHAPDCSRPIPLRVIDTYPALSGGAFLSAGTMGGMPQNPYESPRGIGGYMRPRKLSGLKDYLACIALAIVIHVLVQGITHAIGFYLDR